MSILKQAEFREECKMRDVVESFLTSYVDLRRGFRCIFSDR